MKFKNQAGREIEISVFGKYADDIQIGDASFVDGSPNEEVPDSDLDFIMENHADDVYQLWYEYRARVSPKHTRIYNKTDKGLA